MNRIEKMKHISDVLNQGTGAAAIAVEPLIGKGEGVKEEADRRAVEALRTTFNTKLEIPGIVVMNEGARDKAPRFNYMERVGIDRESSPELRIVLDAVENTNACAFGNDGALSVVTAVLLGDSQEEDWVTEGPDGYFDKLCMGPNLACAYRRAVSGSGIADGITIDLKRPLIEQDIRKVITSLAKLSGRSVDTFVVEMLDRVRNDMLKEQLRNMGVSVRLIGDGDILTALSACSASSDVDLLLGIGAAPEGVIMAAIADAFKGHCEVSPWFPTEDPVMADEHRSGFEKVKIFGGNSYRGSSLIRGSIILSATQITNSPFMKGVRKSGDAWEVDTLTYHQGMRLPEVRTFKYDELLAVA